MTDDPQESEWVEKRFDVRHQMMWVRYGKSFFVLVKRAEQGLGSPLLGIPPFKKATTWRDLITDEVVMRYVPR